MTLTQTILGEQDVFGGVNQADVASGDYAAIYNASELCIGVAKGSTATTNSFTISGNGGPTGNYRIRATVEGDVSAWAGASAALKTTGGTTIATFGPGYVLGSVVQALSATTYDWVITVGNTATTEPGAGDPSNPVYTGIPHGLKLFVEPV
jgi:hypothetical protein